jgi:hypothetical protein
MFLPPRRISSLTVAIPASTVAETSHLREKTSRLGVIGRLLALFRVNEVIIYSDLSPHQEFKLIERILSYMATPQYLRKTLFKITPELKFSGILPPLRTPNHPLTKHLSELKTGEFRQGVVIGRKENFSLLDIGVEKPALVEGKYPLKSFLNVKILEVKNGEIIGEVVEEKSIPFYWGFKVKAENIPISKVIRLGKYGLTIATSKYGEPLEQVEEEIFLKWQKTEKVLIAFGSPYEGLKEILAKEKLNLNEIFDYTVNTVRFQGVETVRVEEAIASTLALLNYLIPR